MRVLLINPPRQNEIVGNNPALIEEERGHNPPLGLLYVAAALERTDAHEVAVIDAQVENLTYEALRTRIADAAPDVVGMTAMTFTLLDVVKTAGIVRAVAPEAVIVAGGPHVHLYPEETVGLPHIDVGVIGEGEHTFVKLVDALSAGDPLDGIPGIIIRRGDAAQITAPHAPLEDLDALPFPARHLTPYRDYGSLLAVGDTVTTLFTSRGCPFRCRFCDRPHLGKRFRARSATNVVDEIAACAGMGIDEFLIYDDTFTVNRQRVLDICDGITARNLDIGFDIRARVDTVDDEMLSSLKAAGCRGIHYGVEAGTEAALKSLNKGITLDQVEQAFGLTRAHGIPVLAYFMIGNPGETEEDIRETFRVARRLRPDYVHMTVLTPFPGTEIYFEAMERGLIDHDVWREFARCPTPDFQPPHWPEHFTREELNALLVEGYRSFYLRPRYILRRLLSLRSWGELKRKAHAGLRVLTLRKDRDR